jgi:hypothetical protein
MQTELGLHFLSFQRRLESRAEAKIINLDSVFQRNGCKIWRVLDPPLRRQKTFDLTILLAEC